MARPKKMGLEYFSADVNIFQDRKIKRLLRKFEGSGFTVYFYLLTCIYSDKGYFYKWDSDSAFDVSDDLNLEEKEVQSIVKYCLELGLFNEDKFHSFSILTSKAIQERWHKIVTDAKRKDTEINDAFDLMQEETGLIQEETIVNSEETLKNKEESTQSKVKESKGKNSIAQESSLGAPAQEFSDFKVGEIKLIKGKYYERQESGRLSEVNPNEITPGMIPDREEFTEYCQLLRYTPDFIEMLYNHLTAKGWSINSEVIQNWKAYVRSKSDWNTDYNLKLKKQRQQNEQLNTDGDLSTEEFLAELHRLEQLNEI
jgi:hypothetical protein